MSHLVELEDLVVRHEGERLKPYRCTAGKLTIGVGRNLDDVGISRDESRFMLKNDLQRVQRELATAVPVYTSLDDVRRMVLADMCFNLGLSRLLGFRRMLAHVAAGAYEAAAAEMRNSRWATQVGTRADRLETMMRTGRMPA